MTRGPAPAIIGTASHAVRPADPEKSPSLRQKVSAILLYVRAISRYSRQIRRENSTRLRSFRSAPHPGFSFVRFVCFAASPSITPLIPTSV